MCTRSLGAHPIRRGTLVGWAALVWTAWLVGAPAVAWGVVRVDAAFGSQMVLQRDMPVPVWGTASPGERISVSFRGQHVEAAADSDGRWLARIGPLTPGAPASLLVSGSNRIVFDDVLVGEVWVGAGQSNMKAGVARFAKRDPELAELFAAAPYPALRLNQGNWKPATSESLDGFSALLFTFGELLSRELGVPVGLIARAVGDSTAVSWLDIETLAADSVRLTALGFASVADLRAEAPEAGGLYATQVEPLLPYAIRGVLWDQGEAGTGVSAIDPVAMAGALIRGWRKAWGQGDFPFLYVQKPSGGGCAWEPAHNAAGASIPCTPLPTTPNDGFGGRARARQIEIMKHPGTAMVTASDLGRGIHPIDKFAYGNRAGRVALGFVYGRDVPVYGPIYASHVVEQGAIRVHFDHTGRGLEFRHQAALQGFELAGSDGVYHWADARIDGDAVVVTSPAVIEPVAVRYGWALSPAWANLFNLDQLPALTFQAGD